MTVGHWAVVYLYDTSIQVATTNPLPRSAGEGEGGGLLWQRTATRLYEPPLNGQSRARAPCPNPEPSPYSPSCRVRPNGISDLAPKSVKKKLKDKAFAAAVSRDDITNGIEALGVDPTEHLQTCIDAMRAESQRLGL